MAGFVKNSCFFIENVPLGVKVDLSKSFYVHYENECDADVLYSFYVVNIRPSKDLIGSGFKNLEGKEDLLDRIEPIPNVNFVHVYPKEIMLHPHEVVKLKIVIDIPKKEEYYGKVWEFGILAQRRSGGYVFEEVTRNQIVTVNNEEQNVLVIENDKSKIDGYSEFSTPVSEHRDGYMGTKKFTVAVVSCFIFVVVVFLWFIYRYVVMR